MAKENESYRTEMLNANQAALFLGVSRSTFLRLVAANNIPTYRMSPRSVRYRRSDLSQFINDRGE